MNSDADRVLEVLQKIHGLLELLAEDKIAERDAKQRVALREIVGSSIPMQKSVHLMDGSRTQKDIRAETSAHQGNLSTMVGRLHAAQLLEGDTKSPKLIISIPSNFFESNAQAK